MVEMILWQRRSSMCTEGAQTPGTEETTGSETLRRSVKEEARHIPGCEITEDIQVNIRL